MVVDLLDVGVVPEPGDDVDRLKHPVNVLVVPGLSLAQLAELGVRRVSAAVEVAQNVRDGVPPPVATPYPAMHARPVEFDALK